MAKKYVFIRMPAETHRKFMDLKQTWEHDIQKITKKPVKITMTKIYDAAVDPEINLNLKKVLKIKKQ